MHVKTYIPSQVTAENYHILPLFTAHTCYPTGHMMLDQHWNNVIQCHVPVELFRYHIFVCLSYFIVSNCHINTIINHMFSASSQSIVYSENFTWIKCTVNMAKLLHCANFSNVYVPYIFLKNWGYFLNGLTIGYVANI